VVMLADVKVRLGMILLIEFSQEFMRLLGINKTGPPKKAELTHI